jgi:hypothetical protein
MTLEMEIVRELHPDNLNYVVRIRVGVPLACELR